jgi:3-hydroxyethyl bacteriochlorophyllide a dehydrogenase
MDTLAVVLNAPEQLALQRLALTPMADDECVVDIAFSGISTGTERLLWAGRMPQFPGMGYPLVPGYESVGRVTSAGPQSGRTVGETVFVPGARCYGEVRGLFGGAASRVVAGGARLVTVPESLGERGALLALAATAKHAMGGPGSALPDLIVGHGTFGRLLARLTVLAGGSPVVWERNADRAGGAEGYSVVNPADDDRRNYRAIYDASGDSKILDTLISRMAPSGEIVLAGFYSEALSFAFPPAFMREARLRVAAQWSNEDLVAVRDFAQSGALSLDGLVTHRAAAGDAERAYRTAFHDVECLKMILDWRDCS